MRAKVARRCLAATTGAELTMQRASSAVNIEVAGAVGDAVSAATHTGHFADSSPSE